MAEGMQITIPDFDDDDAHSTPIFGRSQTSIWGTSSSGLDSPTTITPLALTERAEKSYFHARGDSVTSEDSAHSVQYTTRKSKSPFAHSAQSSVATPGASPFTKKSSFASLRNAFKSSKSIEQAPPLPTLDHQAYPVLKNPFNRSTSSLAQVPPVPQHRPPSHAPASFRPSTPASSDPKNRNLPPKAKAHPSARSQHSFSGSIFHSSDTGSDHGHSYVLSSSPPPVPPVPNASSSFNHRDSLLDFEDQITMDPRTPSDYALHAVFIRFAASAESLISNFLQIPLEDDPLLTVLMGPAVDSKFDDLLASLGNIAQKHAKPVIDSILRWRKSQTDPVDGEIIRQQISHSTPRGMRSQDVIHMLNERKSLASIYIMCRALIAATESISKDGLGEAVGHTLEELTFEQIKRPDVKMLTQSANHRSNAELYAILLGNLANVRFESVTDRFLTELGPVAAGLVPKDADLKYEYLVRGLKHIQIKVWPPEAFEEGAEFLASLSKSFEHAHGNRLKIAFAETLVSLLHPIAKTAQAEVNHPEWAKAIEVIYPRARDMMNKPRYWHVAYPLAVTALCVAPQEFFSRTWNTCFEHSLGKLKERTQRTPALNGILRLIWTYLYRCHESASATSTKMEAILKHFFPSNRQMITYQEDHSEPFIYMLHFVLSRHFDFGSEFCLELLQERAISAPSSNVMNTVSSDKIIIAIKAILLSLHLVEREEPTPAWPSSSDFGVLGSSADYPSSSEAISPALSSKSNWMDLIDRASACLKVAAIASFQSVGKWSFFDEQWASSRLTPNFEDVHNFVIRHHPEGSVAYPNHVLPQITMLQIAYQSWPRCLHSSMPLEDVFDMLVRGVIHVEPSVGEAASQAIQRFISDAVHVPVLLSRLSTFLFGPASIMIEGSGLRLPMESTRLISIWFELVETWTRDLVQKPTSTLTDAEIAAILVRIDEIEAAALFLLAYGKWNIHIVGVKTFRVLKTLLSHLGPASVSEETNNFRLTDAFGGKVAPSTYLQGHDDILEPEAVTRLQQWKDSARVDVALRLAESDALPDRVLWRHIFPIFVQCCMRHSPQTVSSFRERAFAAATRYHQFMANLSGVNSRNPPNGPQRGGSVGDRDAFRLLNENKHLVHQWHTWMKLICATAEVSETRPKTAPRDHSRARSDAHFEIDSMSTSRELFRYLSQYLDSDHTIFRDVAVSCISSFPAHGYSFLLEDLGVLSARQSYDDPRSKSVNAPAVGRARRQERFLTAVARIYYLTAHFLQDQRSSGKQAALAHVLKYVRNMQLFLTTPEHRDLYSLQRFRRYFCGTVERLFDALATLKDSDRFIPANLHLALYRLCEEWCQLGKQSESVKKRLVYMQTVAAKSFNDPSDQAELIQRFQTETRSLSNAAIGAMAALCQKAFYPPDIVSNSPTDRPIFDHAKPLSASSTLDRLTAILASFHEQIQNYGKKALRSILAHKPCDIDLANEVLRRAFMTTRELHTSNARLFEVVADVICNNPVHGFTFSQAVCLGLSNLYHPLLEIRRQAFNMLDVVHEQSSGIISMMQYEAAACSSAPSAYLQAHRLISDVLAGEHPDQAIHVLTQFCNWIPQVFDGRSEQGPLLLLQSLEYWVPSIDLMTEDKSTLSREGRSAVYHLMSLTSRFAESHAEQILVLWTRLVDPPHQSNGHATVRFLLEQAHKVGSTVYISCAARVVACLSQSAVGKQLVEELCSVIEPARMLPNFEHKLAHPDADEMELWSDLDILFSEQPRLTNLGVAQFAFLFLSDSAIERYWEYQDQLPVLLHILLMHLDHRQSFVQQRSRHMLFQILRSCMSGYDEVVDRASYRSRLELKGAILALEAQIDSKLWSEDESGTRAEPKMKWLCTEILNLLEPLHPRLLHQWGATALTWGTACSIRGIAFRSLQLFRALSPMTSQSYLSMLLGRLSSTISEEDAGLQNFNVEILHTLTSLASSGSHDIAILPQLFWCAVACLSTTVEKEFRQVLDLLDALLAWVDLDDPEIVELLLTHKPPNWQGLAAVQPCLLTGLRSSLTYATTFRLLQRLAKVEDSRLIDPSEGRVRDLYTLSLPWCLHAMSTDSQDETLHEFALNVGRLAEQEERPSIDRIMTSFAKNRFRTKDDFLRQSVASLREHYGSQDWAQVVTLLMGLVLNNERWLRVHTMQILKVLFQQRETRNPVDLLGSELLMPLLRLLETDLAAQALEVLDEPMQISGGPAAKHVLRMSLHNHLRADRREVESVAEVFGIAQESGWCVPRLGSMQELCRANMDIVFDLCRANTRPSRINFQPEDMAALSDDHIDDDLGDMVQNLHELSSFFQEEPSSLPMTNRRLEARVAAILAKSTDVVSDVPQTPFVDVFDVGAMSVYEESDDTDSEAESDLFEFDAPSVTRFVNNTAHHH